MRSLTHYRLNSSSVSFIENLLSFRDCRGGFTKIFNKWSLNSMSLKPQKFWITNMLKNDSAKRYLNVWNKLNIEKRFLESFIADNLSDENLFEKKSDCDIDWAYWRKEIKIPELVD
jgi:hypothetical protein